MAANLLACAAAFPVGAADEVPIVGSETLIGELIPITGDPIETRSVDLRIEFHRNSAEVTERAEAQLRELGTALTSEALYDADVALYGHTDSSGPADYNQALSELRAEAVAAFLLAHFAIGEERLREVRGYGESQPRQDLAPGARGPAAGRDRHLPRAPTGGRGTRRRDCSAGRGRARADDAIA